MNKTKLGILCLAILLTGCNQSENKQTKATSTSTEQVKVEDGVKTQAGLPSTFSIGKVATANVIAGWDIDVRPDGMGLPEGSGSVEDGEAIYEDKCSMCHGSFGEGEDSWPKLAGGAGTLIEPRPEKTIGSFWPYASTLWDYINRAMPFPAPQSLEPNEVYAITAYILNMNEIVEDDFVLSKDNFSTVEMPNKDGFYVDDRPDTKNTRCMKDCKDKTNINIVLGPEYSLGKKQQETVPKQLASADVAQQTYEGVCQVCHNSGVANAPKLGNSEDWKERLAKGEEAIYANAINGFNGMPAKGGRSDLSDDTVKATVDYMLKALN
jgi:S-disulfanyl-L-cysteine oxidoreductase SoxD